MALSLIRSVALGIRQLILPGVCLACRQPLPPEENDFCGPCRAQILTDPNLTCPRCSSTVGPHADLTNGCVRCRKESFAFDGAIRLGPYEGRLREIILKMKQSDGEPIAEAMGEAWADAAKDRFQQLGLEYCRAGAITLVAAVATRLQSKRLFSPRFGIAIAYPMPELAQTEPLHIEANDARTIRSMEQRSRRFPCQTHGRPERKVRPFGR